MISLLDVWVMQPELLQSIKWIPWFPIDHEPLPERIKTPASKAYKRIVFSEFGKSMMDNAGLDYFYIPHGVETDVFKPVDRREARARMNLPQDAFIVGMVAANKGNPPRKAFFENIAAFTYLKKKHPDALLYLHTFNGESGGHEIVNLVEFCMYQGLEPGKDVIFADQYAYMLGYPDGAMNDLYNSFDVHMLVSNGEGFGIPILEAQSAGCPVIVGDWTSMGELCFSGWKVRKEDSRPLWTNLASYQFVPDVGAIADNLESAYRQKDNEAIRRNARAGALPYDADTITERYWKPTLEAISESLEADRKKQTEQAAKLKAMKKAKVVNQWGNIGLIHEGRAYRPSLTSYDAESEGKVIEDWFDVGLGLDLAPDTDGINKIIGREIKTDYKLDGLDLKGIVLDIGAHKGIVSCYIAKNYPSVVVYAFEPVRENYEAMLENIKRNKLNNVIPFNLAVTEDGRDVTIYTDPINNSGGSTLYSSGNGQQVKSITVNDIMKKNRIEEIALLKIDCEGAEFEILPTVPLEKVKRLRGEFHKTNGDVSALIDAVKSIVPDVVLTVQG